MTISKMSKSQADDSDDLSQFGSRSRRQLLALAGSAVLAWMARPMRAFAKEEHTMMIHMFAFRWKAVATEEEKDRAITEISAFQGKIPGLLEVHVGNNVSPRGAGYETGGVMKFTDAAALANYTVHPLHKALLAWLLPLIEPIEVDFSA
jgi:stress responsive alpha/beta barrel protein